MRSVLHVIYLIFNEGHTASAGHEVNRVELSSEAIRLARMVRELRPADTEVTGLLALMLLTDARRLARSGPAGELIPLAEQDRSRWDSALIAEGIALLASIPVGPPLPAPPTPPSSTTSRSRPPGSADARGRDQAVMITGQVAG